MLNFIKWHLIYLFNVLFVFILDCLFIKVSINVLKEYFDLLIHLIITKIILDNLVIMVLHCFIDILLDRVYYLLFFYSCLNGLIIDRVWINFHVIVFLYSPFIIDFVICLILNSFLRLLYFLFKIIKITLSILPRINLLFVLKNYFIFVLIILWPFIN